MDQTHRVDTGINFSGSTATPRYPARLAQRIEVARQLLAKGLGCRLSNAGALEAKRSTDPAAATISSVGVFSRANHGATAGLQFEGWK